MNNLKDSHNFITHPNEAFAPRQGAVLRYVNSQNR